MAESGNPAMGLPAGPQGGSESLPVQTVQAQEQSGNSSLPAGSRTKVQETAQLSGTGELPVNAAEAESLPVQAEMPAGEEPGNMLPVSGKENVEQDTQKAVQGMMALLGGQNVSAETAASFGGNTKSAENAEPEGTASEGQSLPADGNQAQEKAGARYTPDMPVEEIVRLMTFEEAGKVIVDTGVCKGQTIAEVAERRPPSLKFYLYGGYRGDNNILRAAAQIMLDSLSAKKAG